MINKETIISAYDEKLTLVQWLKTINKALDEAVLTNVEIAQRGNATFVFVFTFEDGTQVESNEIIVNQGESVNGASIRNGHLYLTLTNGDELDAGNVKPVSSFSINNSQHLIVHYGDGTTQDLGAIFSGNVNIDGTLTTTGKITAPIVDGTQVTGNEIVEKMNNYSFTIRTPVNPTLTYNYVSCVKNGNKLTFVLFISLAVSTDTAGGQPIYLGNFNIPANVASKLIPYTQGSLENVLDYTDVDLWDNSATFTRKNGTIVAIKQGGASPTLALYAESLTAGKTYLLRYEVTFLLNDSLLS